MSQLVQGAAPVIKSIQRGTSSVACGASLAVTVSAVDPDKSVLTINGGGESYHSIWGSLGAPFASGVLTDADTVTLRGGVISYGANSANAVIDWQLVEYS